MNKITIVFLISLIFSSCKKEQMDDCFTSSGKEKTVQRLIPKFTAIELNDRIDLNYFYSSSYYVEVTAGDNLIDNVTTSVKGDLLTIKNENKCNWVRSFKKKLVVNIHAPTFTDFTYRGSGEVNFIDTLKSNVFRLNLWDASGDMYLLLNSNYIELKTHTGPGAIYSKGKCRELVAYLGGMGKLDAFSLQAEEVLAINKNTGSLSVQAERKLKAEILGPGDIIYLGNPEIELVKKASGKLIKK